MWAKNQLYTIPNIAKYLNFHGLWYNKARYAPYLILKLLCPPCFKVTVDTFPGAYLIIVAALALLNSALLFTVRWGLTRSDAMRERDEESNNQKQKEDLLPKEELGRRKASTDVTKEYKRIVSKELDRQ